MSQTTDKDPARFSSPYEHEETIGTVVIEPGPIAPQDAGLLRKVDVSALEAENARLKEDLKQAQRVHGITIHVGNSRDPRDPFRSYTGVVTDVGHADHGYVVESQELNADIKSVVARAEKAEADLRPRILHAGGTNS